MKIHNVSLLRKGHDTFCVGAEKAVAPYAFAMAPQTENRPLWAQNAARLMREQGVTQEQLAPVMDVETRGAVGHYFTGRREPTLAQIQALSKRLGVTVSELLGETPLAADPTKADAVSRLLAEIDEDRLQVALTMLEALVDPRPAKR